MATSSCESVLIKSHNQILCELQYIKKLIPQLQLFITDIGFKHIALPVYNEEKAQGNIKIMPLPQGIIKILY